MEESPAISPHETKRGNLPTLLCLLAAIGLHIAIAFPLMNGPTNSLDEGSVLVYPELFSKGLIAHRDFETLYPPGNIWFLAAAYRAYGTDINVERAVGVLYQLILLTGIFFLFRSRGLGVALAGCLLSSLLTIRLGNVAFAWSGAMGWAVWSLVMLTQGGRPRTRAIWAGIFAGLAVTWRADIAPALILAIGAYCILTKWRWRDFLWLVLAGALALVPLLIHALVVTPSVFLDNIFCKPVLWLHRGRELPLDFCHAYTGQLYTLVVIGTLSALAVGWSRRATMGDQATALFAAGLFSLGIFPEASQRADLPHLTHVAVFSAPLLLFAGSFIFRNRMMPLVMLAAVIMAIPQVLQFLASTHKSDYGTAWITNGDRTVGTSSPGEQKVIDYLQTNSKPNESLFVGSKDLRFAHGNDVVLYHLFPNLRPATYYIEFNPLSANAPASGLAGDISKADWVILNRTWDQVHEPNDSSIAGSNAPNEVIQKKFKLVFLADPYGIYKRIAD